MTGASRDGRRRPAHDGCTPGAGADSASGLGIERRRGLYNRLPDANWRGMETGSMGGLGNDPMMLELFRAELDQHLPVLNEGLLALEKGRATKADIESMMRAAHSIKGAGRVMGLDQVVRVAHTLEDCFSAAKNAKITLTPDAVDILLAGVDCLQRICSPEPEDAPDEDALTLLLERIARVGEGRAVAAPAPLAAPSPTLPAERPAVAVGDDDRIALPALLDAAGAERLRCQLLERLPPAGAALRDPFALRLDFTRLERMGPEALALLLSLDPERGLAPAGSRLVACGVGPRARALFRVSGLDTVLTIVD